MRRLLARRTTADERFDVELAPEVVDVDTARDYDVDLAVAGDDILGAALLLGIRIRSHGSRTARLTAAELDALGLGDLQRNLTGIAEHDVTVMLFRDIREATRRGLNLVLPRR